MLNNLFITTHDTTYDKRTTSIDIRRLEYDLYIDNLDLKILNNGVSYLHFLLPLRPLRLLLGSIPDDDYLLDRNWLSNIPIIKEDLLLLKTVVDNKFILTDNLRYKVELLYSTTPTRIDMKFIEANYSVLNDILFRRLLTIYRDDIVNNSTNSPMFILKNMVEVTELMYRTSIYTEYFNIKD